MARNSSRREFVVIGLGRFGSSLALKLVELGHSVLGVDRDNELVQDFSGELTQAVCLDASDENSLLAIGIEEFDTAIVAIGEDFENAVLITVLLKEFGLRVICRAINLRQKAILQRVGADEVVLLEHDAGVRLARQLTSHSIVDSLELEPGISVSELRCPSLLAGHTIRDLDLHGRFGVDILAIKRDRLRPSPPPDEMLIPGDVLVVIGPDEGLAKLEEWRPKQLEATQRL